MNIVSFGGGTNSTAMIIGMYLHKIPIDLILFADTGGEQPLLCRLGLHSPCKTEYIEVTRRRSDRHGGKYHTNYIVCRRCGKLCYRMRRRREKTI